MSSWLLTFDLVLRLRSVDLRPRRRAPGLPWRAGEDHVAVGTPNGRLQIATDAGQGQQFLPRADIPELDGFAPTTCGD